MYKALALAVGVILTGIFARPSTSEYQEEHKTNSTLTKRRQHDIQCSGVCTEGCDTRSYSRFITLMNHIIRLNSQEVPRDCASIHERSASLNLAAPTHTCDPECRSPFGYPFHCTDNDQISCYKFYPEMDCNHRCAVMRCGKDGAKLVSIETEDEWLHLKGTIMSDRTLKPENTIHRFGGYLTSGSDRRQEGVWIWEATQQPLTYENWGYQYRVWEDPDAEDYLMFDTTSTSFMWWDAADGKRAVLCEKPATCD